MIDIDLSKQLGYQFLHKPLLINGWAMDYYGLRNKGNDIDFIISERDFAGLMDKFKDLGTLQIKSGDNLSLYKDNPWLMNLEGSDVFLIYQFELWKNIKISEYNYNYFVEGSIDTGLFKIISLEKLMFLKSLWNDQKSVDDQFLIRNYLNRIK